MSESPTVARAVLARQEPYVRHMLLDFFREVDLEFELDEASEMLRRGLYQLLMEPENLQ
jgi:hypothetical protein